MNAEPPCPVVDRYLNDLATREDVAALVEAVETDPDALAFLCEAADVEACLMEQLGKPARGPAAGPRILPFWHWRRSGKWLTAGAAAAALLTIAAVVLWPQGGAGGTGADDTVAQDSSGLRVKRFAPGERASAPLQQPGEKSASAPLVQAYYGMETAALDMLRNARIDDGFDAQRLKAGNPVNTDEYLVRCLEAAGVTFPEGAGAAWVPDAAQPTLSINNTQQNHLRVMRMLNDPAAYGPRLIVLEGTVWKFPPGAPIPEYLATEKVLTAGESKVPRPEGLPMYYTLEPQQGMNRFYYTVCENMRAMAETEMYCRRDGDCILITGLAGTPPTDGKPVKSIEDFADLEFSMPLVSGQAAIIHLGRKADGSEWIMLIEAQLVPVTPNPPVQITLGVKPGVLQFDTPALQVKAGAPVRLTYKNDSCASPHNFILIKPGTASAVGRLADGQMLDPKAEEHLYIPDSPDILVAGKKLLRKGDSEVINFTAPTEPGEYPYLCIVPGHWVLQQGILRVVE